MFHAISCAPPLIKHQSKELTRRSANFHPSAWGDVFLKYTRHDKISYASTTKKIEELKKEVKKTLVNVKDSRELMTLIDVIQRTGVAYHFETYIQEVMKQTHMSNTSGASEDDDDDLYSVAIRFRLLRQHGYKAASDVFKRFKDADGELKGILRSDVRGLLSLYEATHLGVQGEDILDEALVFSNIQLHSLLPQLEPLLAKQARLALELPFHKTGRLKAKHYISCYQAEESRNEVLLELSKLDFNVLQAQHQEEIREISRWWKVMDLPTKLPFIRDRLVECYFCTLAVYFEPQYHRARKITTQILAMTSMLDDIYDEYATLEELQLLTDAIERWDTEILHQLPEYMKIAYLALLNIVTDIEGRLAPHERFRIIYLKKVITSITRAYFVEAQWFNSGHVPTLDEYMSVASVTSAAPLSTVVSFVGMNEVVREEDFEWVLSKPKLLNAASIICRLKNDIVGHKAEQDRGNVASSVECYMKDNGCSEEKACEKLHEMVAIAWKDLNHGSFLPTPIPTYLTTRVLNLVRVIEVLYQYGDGYTISIHESKTRMASILIDPFPL